MYRLPITASGKGALWLGLALLLSACGDEAERFFSGRPSDMSMVHNRIIGGPPEATLVLLRVPARFPGARPAHVGDWQSSLIAWWRHADKAAQMRSQFGQLTPAERAALLAWVNAREPGLPAASAATRWRRWTGGWTRMPCSNPRGRSAAISMTLRGSTKIGSDS